MIEGNPSANLSTVPPPAAKKSAAPARRMAPDDRRAQIIASAREVFLQNGFVGTRVRDIAKRAGVTENLIYVRFASKDEIYQAAVTEPLDRLVDRLVSETGKVSEGGTGTRQEKFEQFHKALLSSMVEMAPLLAVALFSVPEAGRVYYAEVALPRFTDAISEVIADVTGWDADELALDVLVEGTIGLHFGVALETIFGSGKLDVQATAHDLARLFGGGITRKQQLQPRTAKGRPSAGLVEAASPQLRVPNGRMSAGDRRAQIALAAREVFLERGFASARTREIAERAGITEQFLFRVFDGKEDLYTAAVEDRVEELLTQLEAEFSEIAGRGTSGIETLRAINRAGIATMAELAPLAVIALFSEMDRGRAFYRRALIPAWRKAQSHLSAVDGWDTAGVDPGVMAQAIFGIHFGTAVHYYLVDRPIDVDQVSRRLTAIIASGIR